MDRTGAGSSAVIAAGVESSAVDLRGYAGGLWLCPAGWGGGAVTFKVAEDPAGTFGLACDDAGALLTVTPTAGRWYPLPEAVMMARAVKFVAASSTTATILVCLKS